MDAADGEIAISCLLTAASVHDRQLAIPLATMTAARVPNLYDLMDSADDDAAIKQHSRDLGHLPIIDVNPRRTSGLKRELAQEAKRRRLLGHRMAEAVRHGERRTAERCNGGLKDNHGGRTVRGRGPEKVMCHLMFGVLSRTVPQLP
ncbi:transposase, IS4 family protein, partial [mine drainage metagenome]